MNHSSIKQLFRKSHLVALMLLTIFAFQSCLEDDEKVKPSPEFGTMTDIDGNTYKTVKIGNQWWMAENLKVTKYRNGFSIPEISDSADWANSQVGGYCIYDNGNGNIPAPGYLYNFQTIQNTANIAPEGWRVPTDDDWKTLEIQLGLSGSEADQYGWRGSDIADKLKSNSNDDWASFGTIFSTNESGFTALAGSCRLENNYFGDPGIKYTGFWWTSTEHSTEEAFYRYLDYKTSSIFRSHVSKNYGFSIRCVKE